MPNDNSTGPHAAWQVADGHGYVSSHWLHQHAPDADFGLYVVKPRSDGTFIGDVVGTHKWSVSSGISAASTPTHTIGYPENFNDPRACDAPATRFNGDNSQLELNCTFANGASGGPLTDKAGYAYASIGGFQQGGINSFPSYGVVWNNDFNALYLVAERGSATAAH